jgi:glutamate/tyrosine decarboxylase-like PLP-dependent enzyme
MIPTLVVRGYTRYSRKRRERILSEISEKIERLRALSASLETSAAGRQSDFKAVGAHSERFLSELAGRPAHAKVGQAGAAIAAFAVSESPATLDEALQTVAEFVDNSGHNLGSSGFFAYIPSGGLYESALADYLAAVSNRYCGVGAAAPGATRLENTMLRWLMDVIGYPDSAEGDLTSGGSMAALSAIVAARQAHDIKCSQVSRIVVYLTAQTHHSFRKALRVAGLSECIVHEVALDDAWRMDCSDLRQQIAADQEQGLLPWLVAATAGTTDSGAVDPLDAIADIAAETGVWMHVDAAYGGAFALCEEGKRRLKGIERSDSLMLDPHKGFFLPSGVGVVLVREGRHLYAAFHARGAYMEQEFAEDTERSPCDYSAELTRPFRALRFWLPFKIHGSRAFSAALEEKLLLAEHFYRECQKIPGIEVASKPDLSIVTFRYSNESSEPQTATRQLFDHLQTDGRIYMTATRIDGEFTIRMAILNYKSHIEDVDLALDLIRNFANATANSPCDSAESIGRSIGGC